MARGPTTLWPFERRHPTEQPWLTIVVAAISALLGLNTKIVYNWLSRHHGNGNHHTAPCEHLKALQERCTIFEKYQIEILQRLSRIEAKIDNGGGK